MSLEIAVLLIMSVSYRRDQYVSAYMREKVGVLTRDSFQNFFPGTYIPKKLRGNWDWIPDFNLAFICALLALKLILLLGVLFHPATTVCLFCLTTLDNFSIVCLVAFTGLYIVDLLCFFHYRRKWNNYLDDYEGKENATQSN